MANPESYKAFAFKEKNGKLEEVTVSWKDPQAGEVIIKVLACGVCGRQVVTFSLSMDSG